MLKGEGANTHYEKQWYPFKKTQYSNAYCCRSVFHRLDNSDEHDRKAQQ